jgi:hypothetical protein
VKKYNGTVRFVTEKTADEIIETREPRGLFAVKVKGAWVGIDNSSGDAWTEEFKTAGAVVSWLLNQDGLPKRKEGQE